jgi:hypothetical protein
MLGDDYPSCKAVSCFPRWIQLRLFQFFA